MNIYIFLVQYFIKKTSTVPICNNLCILGIQSQNRINIIALGVGMDNVQEHTLSIFDPKLSS